MVRLVDQFFGFSTVSEKSKKKGKREGKDRDREEGEEEAESHARRHVTNAILDSQGIVSKVSFHDVESPIPIRPRVHGYLTLTSASFRIASHALNRSINRT